MIKTIHFLYGCPWADGSIQMADTDQRSTWTNVNCKQCLKNNGGYGKERRAKWANSIDPKTDEATQEHIDSWKEMFGENYTKYI